MELKDSQTYLNLARAFAGESQARNRYKFIEYGARSEGYIALADIINKIALNEFHHARMFYSFIQSADEDNIIDNIDISSGYPFREKWNLIENLKLAAQDEMDEFDFVYPEAAKVAKKEGFKNISALFSHIAGIEERHHKMFDDLYNQMKNGTLYEKKEKTQWICGDCGYETTSKQAFVQCPVCQVKQGSVLIHFETPTKI